MRWTEHLGQKRVGGWEKQDEEQYEGLGHEFERNIFKGKISHGSQKTKLQKTVHLGRGGA